MRPACNNHPDRNAASGGLCSMCYMRDRRAKEREERAALYDMCQEHGIKGVVTKRNGRAAAGSGVHMIMEYWDGDLEEKLRAKIDTSAGPDACHLWTGTRNEGGYGMISLGGKLVLGHRVIHALATGDVWTEVVMHTCDNPACCNPRHLKSGTCEENMRDMRTKGRGASPQADHLRNRATHPRRKPVTVNGTPYPSAALAAEALGVGRRTLSRYAEQAEMRTGERIVEVARTVDGAALFAAR